MTTIYKEMKSLSFDEGGTVYEIVDSTARNSITNITTNLLPSYELIAKDVTTLSASGTLSLSDNNIYKLSATGSITFNLPTVTDLTKFHQILIQLYMASAQSIDFGTSYYFNGESPDMSESGYYNIIYEYDNTRSGWVVGALKKASVS